MRYPNNAYIDHDLAFAIGPTTVHSLITPTIEHCSANLNAFRTDKEATSALIPDDNKDLPLTCKTAENTQTVQGFLNTSRNLFNAIVPYYTVQTNRLHVAIASALLGKETNLQNNIYFKKS